jgi:hypothetical protein
MMGGMLKNNRVSCDAPGGGCEAVETYLVTDSPGGVQTGDIEGRAHPFFVSQGWTFLDVGEDRFGSARCPKHRS